MKTNALRTLLVIITLLASTSSWAATVLLIEDTGGFGGASGVLNSDGHTVTVINGEYANGYANLQNLTFLQGFDVVVWGARGSGYGNVTPVGVTTTLENYLQAGGHLIVTGYDTIGSPTDTGLATLVRSSTSGDQVSGNSTWNTAAIDNFILNGLYGDFRSLNFSATGYDDDNLTADVGAGAVALVTFPPGDRVIYTDLPAPAGSVGYWNGGVSGQGADAQPDFSDGGNPQNIFRNWISGIQPGVFVPAVPIPALGSSALVLLMLVLAALGVFALRRRIS